MKAVKPIQPRLAVGPTEIHSVGRQVNGDVQSANMFKVPTDPRA